MKKTLLTSAVILGIAGLVSLAHAREDSQGYGLNFETEVGGSVGTLFGDSAKEENGIERKSKMNENVFVQSIDTNSGFGARIGYSHFGDLKSDNLTGLDKKGLADKQQLKFLNEDIAFLEDYERELNKELSENNVPENQIDDRTYDVKVLHAKIEGETAEIANLRNIDIVLTGVTKNITSSIDLELAKQFKVAPKVTITGLAGVAYANYTQDNLGTVRIDDYNPQYGVINSDKKHAFLPKAGVEAGYDITDNVMATVGYNHIFSRDDIKSVDTANVGLAVKFS